MCYISYICGMYELYIPYLLLIIAIKMLLVEKEKNYKKSKSLKILWPPLSVKFSFDFNVFTYISKY